MSGEDTSTNGSEHVTNYSYPECGGKEWHIQNRVAPSAAYFAPEITHVECVNCGNVDEAQVDNENTGTDQ